MFRKKNKWGENIIPEVRRLIIDHLRDKVKRIRGNTVIFHDEHSSYELRRLICNDKAIREIFDTKGYDLSILARKDDRITFYKV